MFNLIGPKCKSGKRVRGLFQSLVFLLLGLGSGSLRAEAMGSATKAMARPPQFVLFAFDGSKSLSMWQETRTFAHNMGLQKLSIHFTYFINSAYYLAEAYKNEYVAPGLGPGKSAIGFGGYVSDVRARFDQTNFAYGEGHEIAVHAAGHFDGSRWSEVEWESEFNQFYAMLFQIFDLNHAPGSIAFPNGWIFSQKDLIGFRAPQLGQNAALYRVLPQFNIAYDTSKTAKPDYWPTRGAGGIWNFPLGIIEVIGANRKTLSMDYNFYYVQSAATDQPEKAAAFEDQMYKSYLKYFEDNFNGNRAPVNIGHHFAKWNGGAYWHAMKHFAKRVCGMSEVRCVNYRDLKGFLDPLSSQQIAALQSGQFEKSRPVYFPELIEPKRLRSREPSADDYLISDPPEAHEE